MSVGIQVIENQKERAENFDDENDMIDAFVACGNGPFAVLIISDCIDHDLVFN